METESDQMALVHKPQMAPPSDQLIFTYDRKGRYAALVLLSDGLLMS